MGIIAEQWLIAEDVHLSVHRATGLRRLTGLIGQGELSPVAALRFARCRSVHGFGMTRDLDVVFVDSAGAVVSVHLLSPWRIVSDRSASDAFELRAGEAGRLGIVPGSQIQQQIEGEI